MSQLQHRAITDDILGWEIIVNMPSSEDARIYENFLGIR